MTGSGVFCDLPEWVDLDQGLIWDKGIVNFRTGCPVTYGQELLKEDRD